MLEAVFANKPGQTPQDVERRRRMAAQLLAQSQDSEPIRSPWQGVAKVAQALMGGYEAKSAENDDKRNQSNANKLLADTLLGTSPSIGDTSTPLPSSGGSSSYRDAIASIESAGSGDYGAIGPTNSKMGRALGRYQIMEANIGPWSREALGREVSPQEFLTNPKIQDAIFDSKFGGYVKQFGPEGAAQAWFAGPGGVGKTGRKDVLGTSVGEYGNKFARALGSRPTQVASLDPSAGFGDHGPVTQLSPEERQKRLAANQAGMANFTDAGVPAANPAYSGVVAGAGSVPIQGNPNGILDLGAGSTGEIRQGPDGQPYQYVETTGMAGNQGGRGWIRVNAPQTGVGVGNVPASSGGQPAPMDWTDVPQLSVAAGVPFDNSQVPGDWSSGRGGIMARPMPQGAPQPQANPNQAISDELLRKNDLALGGIMAPQGTPQPQGAALGGAFPSAPSVDRAPVASQGYFPPAPAQNDRRAMIAQLLGNPYTAEAGQQLLMQEYKRQQEASDPANQLEIEYKRAQLDALRNKPAEKPTSDIQEYEYAKKNDGYTGTLTEFIRENKKAGSTQVNVGGTSIEGEKKYDQTVGEGYAKDFNTMQTEAGGARKAITSLGAMEKEMDNPNFYSGAGGTTRENLKRLAASMGLDTEAASSMEAFGALSKKAVLDAMGGSLGTGVSNADRDYIEGQVPTIDTSPAGNKKIIGIQRKINQRKIEVAQRARDYARTHNGRIDAGFYDELDQWSEEHPLFEKEEAPTSAPATSGNDGWFDVPGGGRIKGSF